jgi:hypothetical protein
MAALEFRVEDATAATAENAAQAAISAADAAMKRLNKRFSGRLETAIRGSRAEFNEFMSTTYRAIVVLEDTGSVAQFLSGRGVKVHGNVTNKYQALVRVFVDTPHSWIRSAATKRAEVIALARLQGVTPEDFPEWQKKWPVEKACAKYLALRNQTPETQYEEAPREAGPTERLDHASLPVLASIQLDGSVNGIDGETSPASDAELAGTTSTPDESVIQADFEVLLQAWNATCEAAHERLLRHVSQQARGMP